MLTPRRTFLSSVNLFVLIISLSISQGLIKFDATSARTRFGFGRFFRSLQPEGPDPLLDLPFRQRSRQSLQTEGPDPLVNLPSPGRHRRAIDSNASRVRVSGVGPGEGNSDAKLYEAKVDSRIRDLILYRISIQACQLRGDGHLLGGPAV
jgi:hypothetical protein